MAQIQWFPGHMAKARREITEKLKLVDIVLEILDARVPLSSSNPMMNEILANKPKLVLLNKANLADKKETRKWLAYYESLGIKALDIDLIDNYNVKQIVPACQEVLANEIARSKEKGYSNFKIRALVVGIPNVGKSTFINTVAKRKAAVVGDKPGVTKSQTWIKVNENLELLDTPGILWPKFDEEKVAFNLCAFSAIKEEVIPHQDIAYYILNTLSVRYPNILKDRFKIEEVNEESFDIIGKNIGAYKNDEIDYKRVYKYIINEIKSEHIKGITFDYE